MKTTHLLFLLSLFLFAGCDDIDYDHSEMDSFSAYPVIGDQSIQIDLIRTPKYVCGTVDGPPTQYYAPDYCELYVSNDPDGPFENIYTARHPDKGDASYTMKAINGKPYYFYTLSYKKGFQTIQTPTVMVVPGPQPAQQEIAQTTQTGYTYAQHISYSPVTNKIIYYVNNNEDPALSGIWQTDPNGSYAEQIIENGFNPYWDRTGEKIFYGNNIYDCKTKETTVLPIEYTGTTHVSPDNNHLLYQAYDQSYNKYIHILDLQTMEETVIMNFNLYYGVSSISWINDDEYFFSGGLQKHNISKASVKNRGIISTFTSEWNDYAPSISPDKQKMAFISDRSGNLQVWIYNYASESYRQITGYQKIDFTKPVMPLSNIEWLDNSTICFQYDNKIIRIDI